MTEIAINHSYLRHIFVDSLLKIAVNERFPESPKDGFDIRCLNHAYAVVQTLREIFPTLDVVAVYWVPQEQTYELAWGKDIFFKSDKEAQMAARLTTLMREWAGTIE